MSRKTTAKESLPVARANAVDEAATPAGSGDGLPPAWLGMPWMGWWMQGWTTWLQNFAANATPASDDDRRNAVLPWLPKVESTVVPFRRRDDPPGAEGARISLRVRVPGLPWSGDSGSVISIDTMTPRGAR